MTFRRGQTVIELAVFLLMGGVTGALIAGAFAWSAGHRVLFPACGGSLLGAAVVVLGLVLAFGLQQRRPPK